jgi:hypothetical protein
VGDIHRLVIQHGREKAREMVPARHRHLVDIAAEVLADEAQSLGITYSGFCLTAFPHKRLEDAEVWEKRGHNVTLLVEPGRLKTGSGPTELFGVPYGARARMILIYLQTQAVRTRSREVRLGRSMRDWMGRMGMTVGGETVRALRDQARRISACNIKFFWTTTDEAGRASDSFERGAIVRNGCDLAARSGPYAPRCAVLARGGQPARWAPLAKPVPVTPRVSAPLMRP